VKHRDHHFLVARTTSGGRPPRVLVARLRRVLLAGTILAALSAAACERETPLRIRYLPGFVPATQHVLPPRRIMVLPAGGTMAAGEFQAGAIYGADGHVKRTLVVKDLGPLLTEAVKRCLSDAGLNALAGITGEVGGTPPLTIATEIESVSVDQRFGRQRTI